MASRDFTARVAAAIAAAARDREPCCVFCRATVDLEPWREEHFAAGYACVDAVACRVRFREMNLTVDPPTTSDAREAARVARSAGESNREGT